MISPHFPTGWNRGAVYDLPVGSNTISFVVAKHGRSTTYSLMSIAQDWNYNLAIKGLAGHSYMLNGKVVTARADEVHLKGKINTVVVTQ